MVVAAIALVDMDTAGPDAGQSLQIGDYGTEVDPGFGTG
jgi:hypothetical protein